MEECDVLMGNYQARRNGAEVTTTKKDAGGKNKKTGTENSFKFCAIANEWILLSMQTMAVAWQKSTATTKSRLLLRSG